MSLVIIISLNPNNDAMTHLLAKKALCDLSTEGSSVITRAYQPYTLVGPPVRELALDPLAVYV